MSNYQQRVPTFQGPIIPDGSGAAYGIGTSPTTYVQNEMVGGTPSIQPSTIYRAPTCAFRYAPIAWLQQPYQHGINDLYSYRVRAPAVPYGTIPYNETAVQIFRNGSAVGEDIVLSAPPIPTGAFRRVR